MDAVRAEQLQDIRARIAAGEYAVDPAEVAAAIVARLLAARRPKS